MSAAYFNAIRASEGLPAWGRRCPCCGRIAYAWVGEICEDCENDLYEDDYPDD